jgi:hypothetical protein
LAAYDKYHNTASIAGALTDEQFCSLELQPNPADGQAQIFFSIPERSKVQLALYDNYGRLIRQLANQEFQAGQHHLSFNAEDFAPGIYFLKLRTENHTKSVKVLISR